LTPLDIIIATAWKLQHPEFSHVCGACPCADADDFHHSKAKFFCLASFLARKKNEACHLANVFFVSARKLAKQKVFALG
jgi:hypothetical protein